MEADGHVLYMWGLLASGMLELPFGCHRNAADRAQPRHAPEVLPQDA